MCNGFLIILNRRISVVTFDTLLRQLLRCGILTTRHDFLTGERVQERLSSAFHHLNLVRFTKSFELLLFEGQLVDETLYLVDDLASSLLFAFFFRLLVSDQVKRHDWAHCILYEVFDVLHDSSIR